MSDYLLGIDMGTASSKGVLVSPDGAIVATATRPHMVSYPRPGWAEVDAEDVWWTDVVALCRELTEAADGRIAGVCISGVGPCLVLCDEQDRPLRPAILYGIDMRAGAEIAELTDRYGPDQIVVRGGTVLSSQAVGPKMLWVRRNEPEVWDRAVRWYNSSSFVTARMTGSYVLDHHTASQCNPLYDIVARDWCDDWAADIAPGLRFPALAWPSEVVGTVHADAASETGLPEGTPVCAGTVDAWAEAFSVGVRQPGDLMLMYGSTMFFVQVLHELRRNPLLWTTCGVEPGSYTLAAGMTTSGILTEWVRRLTGDAPFSQLVAEAAATPPGAEGLVLLPYFAGERTPIFDPQARGVVAGLNLNHGRGHVFRAVYEGIAYGIRQILELIDEAGGSPRRIVAVGGGTQGGLWTQIVSDVTGRPQVLPAVTIGASYGDALLAAIGTGLVSPSTDWARTERTVRPDDATFALYEELYDAYRALYPATRDVVHRLARIQESRVGNA
jgi:xylulokinase